MSDVITIRRANTAAPIHQAVLMFKGRSYDCSIGKTGMVDEKIEGDGATPIGQFAALYGYYRADRLDKPVTDFPLKPLPSNAGWCDDVASEKYNQYVDLPFDGSHEKMNRADHLYDICIVLDYNIDPAIPPLGSAIFFHLQKQDAAGAILPTRGCIGLTLGDMKIVLRGLKTGDVFDIQA